MIFKKKYVRSEWFEGLLEAEELHKQGYSKDLQYTENNEVLYYWFSNHSGTKIGFHCIQFERCKGIMDYLDHLENRLKASK